MISKGTKSLAGVVCAITLFSMNARADISGSDPHAALPTTDSCVGCLFAYVQFTAANAGQSVLSYQFYNASASTTNQLTPILFEKTGLATDRTFNIIGIGATSGNFAPGYNNVLFALASGSKIVTDANTYFGYVDGDAAGNGNQGTIATNYPTGPGNTTFYHLPVSGALTSGQSLTDFSAFSDPNTNQNNRTYSLQVTTTPEPGFYGLLGTGLSAVIFAVRRRRTRSNN